MRRQLVIIALIICSTLSAAAQEGFAKFYEAAKKGDAKAQNEIGLCYDQGVGVAKDAQQAFLWYSKSAAQNYPTAQYNVGVCYYYGRGVALSYEDAVSWYRKAANQGFAQAQYNLGICYMNGQGVTQNYTQALYWYLQAGKQDLPIANYNAGMVYYNGWGVDKDVSKAFALFQKAADKGYVPAYNNLGVCYKAGEGVHQNDEQAAYWYQKAADHNDAIAQDNLAMCYVTGQGVKQDFAQAVYWLEKSVAGGYEPAKGHLAETREKMRNQDNPAVPQKKTATSTTQGTKFNRYITAAQNGDAAAQNSIGICYFDGNGVEKDEEKAVYWFRKSAEQGHAHAQYNLGLRHYYGQGVEQDYKKAMQWFQKAANQGLSSAMNNIGVLYKNGLGVEKDYTQAIAWFKKAADKGNKKAKENLEKTKIQKAEEKLTNVSDVDVLIPQSDNPNSNKFTFAVIIGNEAYANEADVPYAENDALVFKEYVEKTLGVPEKQIRVLANATLNNIRSAVRWLKQAMSICGGKGRVIFYYAGHGIPDEETNAAYLLPADGFGSDIESAYSLKTLYAELGKMDADRITVFLDACFSGTKREGGMLASARGVALKAKEQAPEGKMVVFTAAQGSETAYPYKEKRHGMFTYYLLKKLQETRGTVSLGELGTYLTDEVKRQSFIENDKMQTPTVISSPAIGANWGKLQLK